MGETIQKRHSRYIAVYKREITPIRLLPREQFIAISNNWKLNWKRKMQKFFWHFKNIFVVFIELFHCFPFDCCRYKKTRKEVSLFVGHFEFHQHRHYSCHPDAGFCCHHSFLQSSRQRTVCCHGTYFVIMSVRTVQTSV